MGAEVILAKGGKVLCSSAVYFALGFKRKVRGGNSRKGRRKTRIAIPVLLCGTLRSLR